MFAKMLLPLLGGTPAVWITCVLFFQLTMLAGYGYAHLLATRARVRRSAVLHVILLALPLLVLPVAVPAGWTPPVQQNPIPWLLLLLTVAIGLPFFFLSTTAPTLQRWFAASGRPGSTDPYFLYAASNLGSMLGLLSYPLLIEPTLTLAEQSRLWSVAYYAFLALAAYCALLFREGPAVVSGADAIEQRESEEAVDAISRRAKARWIVLAAVPSSLMLGVTSYLATDIPPVPLLLVVPVAIYLGTFILVFSRKQFLRHELLAKRLPFLVLTAGMTIFLKATGPPVLLVPLHLLTFFVVAMVCHGELARSRPSARHLTLFYLCISVGGVLGGLFNALLAPLIFNNVFEYPLALIAAVLLSPRRPGATSKQNRWADLFWPAAIAVIIAAVNVLIRVTHLQAGELAIVLMGVPAGFLCLSFARKRLRFALGMLAIMLSTLSNPYTKILHMERSFFGVYRVLLDPEWRLHYLMHGSTLHGAQSLDPARQREALTYYHRTGPLGQIFENVNSAEPLSRIGLIGLGAGSVACYGRAGQDFTFYEIDPTVERIARDTRYFTFLQACPPNVHVVLGDARLSLHKVSSQQYKLLVIDAFSSDVIPIHLLTREAFELYVSHTTPHGLIALNISNRYLDLRPVLGNLAADAGLLGIYREDRRVSEQEQRAGRSASVWAVLGRAPSDLTEFLHDPRWKPLPHVAKARVWTDDFSNILSVIKFR